MKLADLRLKIDALEREHGPSIMQEPLFCGECQSGDFVLASSLDVVIATHPQFANALARSIPAFENHVSKIGVVLS